jgi:hypothetical protein
MYDMVFPFFPVGCVIVGFGLPCESTLTLYKVRRFGGRWSILFGPLFERVGHFQLELLFVCFLCSFVDYSGWGFRSSPT